MPLDPCAPHDVRRWNIPWAVFSRWITGQILPDLHNFDHFRG
jgi:hypothetical protein